MKKILLSILIIGFAVGSYGQDIQNVPPPNKGDNIKNKEVLPVRDLKGDGQVFWEEHFDWGDSTNIKGWVLPEGWENTDNTAEDLGYMWEWHNDTLEEAQFGLNLPLNSTTSENGFLSHNLDFYNRNFHFSDMPSVDASIMTPPIDCSEHPSVLFKMEHMFRYWSTAIMILEVTADDGVHWAEFDLKMGALISETPGNISSDTVAHFVANITTAAAGQESVRLRITWRDSRLYYWNIDDLVLTEALDNDLQMKHFIVDYDNGIEDTHEGFFWAVPKSQISSYSFEASSRNFGDNEQTGVKFNIDISKNNSSIWTANSPVISQETFQWDTLFLAETYTPEDFGHYKIDLGIQQDQEDQKPDDNSASIYFNITDSVFSRCDDEFEVSSSTWEWYTAEYSHEGDYIATKYTIKNDIEVSSMSALIRRARIDGDFRFVLIEITVDELGDEEYTELLGTEFVTVDSTNNTNTWVTLPFELDGEGEFLQAGHTYLAAVQYWINVPAEDRGAAFSIGSDRSTFHPATASYMYMNEGWFTRGTHLHMCRLNFNVHDNIIDGKTEIENYNSLGQNYPNPFRNSTEINYEISSSSDVSLEVYNITGKKVKHFDQGYKNAGKHVINLNVENLNAGVYYYKLISNNYSSTKKMIISK